jgi:hypothetical protein
MKKVDDAARELRLRRLDGGASLNSASIFKENIFSYVSIYFEENNK